MTIKLKTVKMKKKNQNPTPDMIIIDRTTTIGSKTKLTSKTLKRDEASIPVIVINQTLSDIIAPLEPTNDLDVFIGDTGKVYKTPLTNDELKKFTDKDE